MYDIITFGSATKDIFIKSKDVKVIKNKSFITGKGVCFNLGSKVDIEEILFSSGGGGTNTAATFVNQGFKVAYCGAVGDDLAGQEIIEELTKLGIDTQFIIKAKKESTNHSIIITGVNSDRTILVYKGASEDLSKENIPWCELKADWFYIAPLFSKIKKEKTALLEDLVNFGFENNIKIALNPASAQIFSAKEVLKRILKKVNVLILNQEEASLLTKTSYQREKEIFKKIDEICSGIAIMTKGKNGVVVSDGKIIYSASSLPTKVVDKTGAGDAFGSGFLAGYLRFNKDIVSAIQLGIANSVSCINQFGAKNGLLKKNQKFSKVKVHQQKII